MESKKFYQNSKQCYPEVNEMTPLRSLFAGTDCRVSSYTLAPSGGSCHIHWRFTGASSSNSHFRNTLVLFQKYSCRLVTVPRRLGREYSGDGKPTFCFCTHKKAFLCLPNPHPQSGKFGTHTPRLRTG